MTGRSGGKSGMLTLTGLGGLYAYVYCMMVSQALLAMPIFGGALFMCGRVATVFFSTYAGQTRSYLPRRARRWGTALLVVLLVVNLALVVLYPITLDSPMVWVLLVLILTMTMRDVSCRRLVRLSVTRDMAPERFALLFSSLHALPILITAGLLLYNLPAGTAWPLLGGYALMAALEIYAQLKDREDQRTLLRPVSEQQAQRLQEAVRGANAFTAYETLSTLILAALQMTLVLIYTFLAMSAQQILTCMVLAVLCTLGAREAAEFILRSRERKREHDPTHMMLVGLFLWLYGLMLFDRLLRGGGAQLINVYICLGLCSAGAAVCETCLSRMERAMLAVARFTAGDDVTGYRQMRVAGGELATLLGEMLALAALTCLCFVTGKDLPRDLASVSARFQPVMVVPALLTVLGALLAVFRFPLTGRYMEKLSRFLRLRDMGGENPALEKQLRQVVVKPHRQPFGTNLVKAVLRPFYRHTLKGTENIVPDDNNPLVFLCNHGEMYGPIVTMLYIPVPIRPWTISEITVDKDEVAAYVYKFTIKRQKWLPERLKWPIARLIGPISVWAMNQLETIPVYRNKPRELMTTFRLSVEAMQAGDNLLIFPENPNAAGENHGYERSGMGELFSGFAMLAPIYYNKTGKRCRFLPMYAHKNNRTLTFGRPVTYDPDNAPNEERDRIVDYVKDEMLRIAAEEEAAWKAGKPGRKRVGKRK